MAQKSDLRAGAECDDSVGGAAGWPRLCVGSPNASPAEIYGSYVLTNSKLKKSIAAATYRELQAQMKTSRILDPHLADVVAHAAKDWAISMGATHFTHVFQPLTGSSAEKQDSFLSFSKQTFDSLGKPAPIDSFTGSQLLQSEPDASSFPHGGMRSTFEARGYTIWEPSSPLYLYPGPLGTKVLCIPSIFISYDGKVLDEKTILLRSEETLNSISLEILRLLGVGKVSRVSTTLGVEQEFFLIEKSLYEQRMDLKLTGATLFGNVPPKHQQLEDHYFKKVPERELSVMAEAELMLCKLGVPCKTRHSEVSQKQFEMAPIFEDSPIASDHNVLTMTVLRSAANKYGMEALFNEKPFKGVNGSGKHCNWSMTTDTGMNLLDPGKTPASNMVFLTFLTACLDAVYKYGDLLLASITSSSNRHRLGASEAPPGIISVFLGSYLTKVLDSLTKSQKTPQSNHKGANPGSPGSHLFQNVEVDPVLDIKLECLPQVPRDLTDRNRTSPFAFTGNKFEFRAVGSQQLPYLPITLLNAAVSDSLCILAAEIKASLGGRSDLEDAKRDQLILEVLKKHVIESSNVRFEGNNYSSEWVKEAISRGIAVSEESFISNYKALVKPKNKKMLLERKIFTEEELHSRYKILTERYAMDIAIECETLHSIITSKISPELFDFKKSLTEYVNSTCGNSKLGSEINLTYETRKLKEVSDCLTSLEEVATTLVSHAEGLKHNMESPGDLGPAVLDAQLKIGEASKLLSQAEYILPGKMWPVPSYYDMFF